MLVASVVSNSLRPHGPRPSRLLSMGFSRQEYWSGLPFSSPVIKYAVSEVKSLSHVRLFATPWTAVYQAPPSIGFSRQEYWSGLPLPSSANIPQFSSVQLLSRVQLFPTSWITARQASLSITISRSSHKPTSIESVMPSSHLILRRPLFLPPLIITILAGVLSSSLSLSLSDLKSVSIVKWKQSVSNFIFMIPNSYSVSSFY